MESSGISCEFVSGTVCVILILICNIINRAGELHFNCNYMKRRWCIYVISRFISSIYYTFAIIWIHQPRPFPSPFLDHVTIVFTIVMFTYELNPYTLYSTCHVTISHRDRRVNQKGRRWNRNCWIYRSYDHLGKEQLRLSFTLCRNRPSNLEKTIV